MTWLQWSSFPTYLARWNTICWKFLIPFPLPPLTTDMICEQPLNVNNKMNIVPLQLHFMISPSWSISLAFMIYFFQNNVEIKKNQSGWYCNRRNWTPRHQTPPDRADLACSVFTGWIFQQHEKTKLGHQLLIIRFGKHLLICIYGNRVISPIKPQLSYMCLFSHPSAQILNNVPIVRVQENNRSRCWRWKQVLRKHQLNRTRREFQLLSCPADLLLKIPFASMFQKGLSFGTSSIIHSQSSSLALTSCLICSCLQNSKYFVHSQSQSQSQCVFQKDFI